MTPSDKPLSETSEFLGVDRMIHFQDVKEAVDKLRNREGILFDWQKEIVDKIFGDFKE